MKWKIAAVILIFALILLPPLLLRPEHAATPANNTEAERLVVITPHNDAIKTESANAFARYYREKFGRDIVIDYRAPGGTSDIVRFIAERFKIEFRDYAEKNGIQWTDSVAAGFADSRTDRSPKAAAEVKAARKLFLASDVGIGIDLMYGGGVFDMARQADSGFAVDAGIVREAPELLDPAIVPESFGGEKIYDKGGRYYGLCLSTFGICCNDDRLAEMADRTPPKRWADLASPRFFNNLVLADPSKSGSANKCYEIILQQCMAERNSAAAGWTAGLNLLKRMFANASFITDSAGKVARDVASGAAAVGMAIDTYGLTEREWNELQFRGKAHFRYIAPEGGTAVSTDPVQLLRGAPNRHAAKEFIKFMLSPAGQKILCFRPGTPGGPEKFNLRRPPVRRDLYDKKYESLRCDPDYNPYDSGASFVYRPQWTGKYYSLLRILIRTTMLDCHDELKAAWRAILNAGGPEKVPEAMREFDWLPFDYSHASEAASSLSGNSGTLEPVRVRQRWRSEMRRHYLLAEKLAKEGR